MCGKDRTTSYFIFSGQFFEQTDSLVMGLPLPPLIANFMEDSEEVVLSWATHRLLFWFRYMDKNYHHLQSHGPDKLKEFLDHHGDGKR
jgi:hypothetical protein